MGLQVANTILNQLGGVKFRVMTGAKNFIGSADALSFHLPGGGGFCKDGINGVRITLDPSDTYTVQFFRRRGAKLKVIATVSDVYCDMLRQVFENHTGLRTSL
jgi:hypothetical protein